MLPARFAAFQGYNDFIRKKEELRRSADGLNHHLEELSAVLIQPWFSVKQFEVVRSLYMSEILYCMFLQVSSFCSLRLCIVSMFDILLCT